MSPHAMQRLVALVNESILANAACRRERIAEVQRLRASHADRFAIETSEAIQRCHQSALDDLYEIRAELSAAQDDCSNFTFAPAFDM